jgi:hypothetical protein
MITLHNPVLWPMDIKTTKHKDRYPGYKISLLRALAEIEKNSLILGLRNVRIYTNHIIDENWVRVGQHNNSGPAAAMYFVMKGNDYVLACDRFFTVKENLFAIAKSLEGYVLIHRNCKAFEVELLKQPMDQLLKEKSA